MFNNSHPETPPNWRQLLFYIRNPITALINSIFITIIISALFSF